jgi:hypothetical protein
MTDPLPADTEEDDDAIAELLLANAVTAAGLAPVAIGVSAPPDMGEPEPEPDMGEPLTVPTPPAPAPTPPVPAPVPVPPAPPVSAPPAPPAAPPTPTPDPATGTDAGFPANTPVAEMTPPQQVAYWKYQSRRHEDRVKAMSDYDTLKADHAKYQDLVAASQTEHEKAVTAALQQGRTEAIAETGDQLVEAYIRAVVGDRAAEDVVTTVIDGTNLSKFHSAGKVDAAKVHAFVNTFAPAAPAAPPVTDPAAPPPAPAPAPPRGPTDFGQGQPTTAKPSGLDAGREIARQRFAKTTTGTQAATQ